MVEEYENVHINSDLIQFEKEVLTKKYTVCSQRGDIRAKDRAETKNKYHQSTLF